MIRYITVFLVRSVGLTLVLVPRSLTLFFGSVLGIGLFLIRYRFNVVQSNLLRVFPRLKARQILKVYLHLGKLFYEMTLLAGGLRQFTEKYAILHGLENWEQARSGGTGVILISHHGGNWEVMVARGALSGIDILMVTKRLKPQWLHQQVELSRKECGTQATYEPKTLKDVLAHLKKGGTVGFVMDQYAGPPVGIRVPFFGVPVGTPAIVATLVKRTGARVLLASNYRDSTGRFHVRISKPLDWISEQQADFELAVNTARYTEIIEESILEHWDQWLWTHRRFKGDLSPLKEDEWYRGRPRHG